MSKKQKRIIIDTIIVLAILLLAVSPVFGGKSGIQLVSGLLSGEINNAISK